MKTQILDRLRVRRNGTHLLIDRLRQRSAKEA